VRGKAVRLPMTRLKTGQQLQERGRSPWPILSAKKDAHHQINRKEDTMSHLDIIHAWKDEEYRLSLSEAERALLPDDPSNLIRLQDQLAIRSGALTLPIIAERCARNPGWAAVVYPVAAAGGVL